MTDLPIKATIQCGICVNINMCNYIEMITNIISLFIVNSLNKYI